MLSTKCRGRISSHEHAALCRESRVLRALSDSPDRIASLDLDCDYSPVRCLDFTLHVTLLEVSDPDGPKFGSQAASRPGP
jgi:hypothetical protein